MSASNRGLHGRVRRLEARAGARRLVLVWVWSFIGGELERVTSGALEWVRHPDESADEFRARVCALPHVATAGTACTLVAHNTPPETINHHRSPA